MHGLEEFADIIREHEPLAPYTWFRLGGPAEALAQPKTRGQLIGVVRRCLQRQIPLRILGCGCNILIRDEGVRGVVVRLSEPEFTKITVDGKLVRAESGAMLTALISQTVRHNLAGLETLIGIAGTVGGALRTNAGDRAGDTGQSVTRVEVIDDEGNLQVRERSELRFGPRWSNLDEPVLLAAEFRLEFDQPDAIVKRMRKAWILRRASQPSSAQSSGRIFKNPKGLHAAALIEQAGLAKTRVGGVEVSDRNANHLIAHDGACARDALRLIELIRSRIRERFNLELELEIAVW